MDKRNCRLKAILIVLLTLVLVVGPYLLIRIF